MAENETMNEIINKREQEPAQSMNTLYAKLFLKNSQALRRDGIKSGIIATLKIIKKICDSGKTDEENMRDIRGFVDSMMSKSAYGKQHPSLDDYIDNN